MSILLAAQFFNLLVILLNAISQGRRHAHQGQQGFANLAGNARCNPRVDVLLDGGQAKVAAMSIYKVLRKAERFGASFRVCDSKNAGVGSCDQFLTELSLRDCSVYAQRAYAIGLAHFFSRLHTSGGDPNHVTRQIVGNYISSFAKGAKQGAVVTHSAQTPRQPRTINHRLSVLASYFELLHSPRYRRWARPLEGSHQPSLREPSHRRAASRDDRARLAGAPATT
jgi:hypothetical protein